METINLELISPLLLDNIFAAVLGEKKSAFREGLKMESERIFCNKCGAENEKSSKFCKKCGAALYYVSQPNKPSAAWYLLPILFGILGGIIGYIVIKVKDEKMAKNILYVGLGTFVLGIIFIAAVPSPPPVDTGVPISTPTPIVTPTEIITPTLTATPTPIQITRIDAIDLAIEFDENEIAAEQKYKGKIIEVEGIITDFGTDILNNPYLKLAGIDEYGFTDIACYFPSEATTDLATLAKWDEIVVRGECRGKLMHVMLKNCELVRE